MSNTQPVDYDLLVAQLTATCYIQHARAIAQFIGDAINASVARITSPEHCAEFGYGLIGGCISRIIIATAGCQGRDGHRLTKTEHKYFKRLANALEPRQPGSQKESTASRLLKTYNQKSASNARFALRFSRRVQRVRGLMGESLPVFSNLGSRLLNERLGQAKWFMPQAPMDVEVNLFLDLADMLTQPQSNIA